MARGPRREHPHHPGDVVCDTCPARSPWMDGERATWERARVLGWRLYRGASVAGSPLVRRICPNCWSNGSPAPPVRARDPIAGQMDPPGMITPILAAKGKKNNRQMS